MVKNPPANAGDTRDIGSIPGWGKPPGEEHGNPLQYSCHLFLLSSVFVRSIPFLSFIVPQTSEFKLKYYLFKGFPR